MSAGVLASGLLGLLLLVLGGELLVRGASRIAGAAGLSPLVVGLTVVAFGTSAPELAVSADAALSGRPDLALGNVVGSNIFNVLLILGASALITPLAVHERLVRRDVPLMIGSGVLLLLLALDGRVARWEGGLLAAGIAAYTAWSVVEGRRTGGRRPEGDPDAAVSGSDVGGGDPRGRLRLPLGTAGAALAVAAGLLMLIVGARWLVEAAAAAARTLGVSELAIGVTVVAAGTSLPEVATSLVAAIRGQRDIAVGNVVGSNLFNVLAILGTAALISPDGIAVPGSALRFDIPVMIAASVACLPTFLTGRTLGRREGLLLLGSYAAYVALVLTSRADPAALPGF